jgi:uncharacterized protein YchJ
MKLGALLSEIKGKQSRLARLMQVSRDIMYVETGKKPKLDYKEVAKEIDELIDSIRNLKLQVMQTNMGNMLPDTKMTLAEAIIKVADLRSQIAYKTQLVKYSSRSDFWDTEKKVEFLPQVEEKVLEDELKKLSDEKIKLDNLIQKVNWSIEVS